MAIKTHDFRYSTLDDYTDDESDSELALDLKGHKHVHQNESSDGVYWLQKDTQSSYVVFPVPGKASAHALREFLESHLPPHLIINEYGCVKPIAEISDDHLPMLQAQMWLSKHDGSMSRLSRSPTREKKARIPNAASDNRSHMELRTSHDSSTEVEALLAAFHITFIAGLLQSNHIFVLGAKIPRPCEFPSCASRSDNQPRSSTIVTIEPLIHWGTVTPAADVQLCRGSTQAFRRNGEKCDDPLWTQAIKAYRPQHPTSYCSDCLNMLLDIRATTWDALQQNPASSFTAINSSPVHVIQTLGVNGTSNHAEGNNKARFTLGCKRTSRENKTLEGKQPTPCESSFDPNMDASLSLDGTCDTPPEKYSGTRTSNNELGSISFSARREVEQRRHILHSDTIMNKACSTTAGFQSPNESAFTPNSTTVSEGNVHCAHTAASGWNAVNGSPSTPSLPSTDKDHDPQPVSPLRQAESKNIRSFDPVPRKYSANTGNSFTPNPSTRREFGRELNTNVILKSHKDFTMATSKAEMAKSSAHEAEDIRKFFSSALAPATLTRAEHISKKAKIIPPSITTSPEGNGSETSWETASTDSPAKVSNGSSPTVSETLTAKNELLRSARSTFPFKKFPPLKFITTSKPTSPTATPFFAKRADTTPYLPDVSSYTYTAYISRVPAATEIICTCSRSASTPSTQIAQCANTGCTIGWYHYDCLDKSGKISARHGRLVCRVCKNEQEFKEKDKEMGWTMEKLVEAEMQMAFDGKDIVANLPGLGGVEGVVGPYGFGMQVDEVHVQRKEDKGALGELAFLGYLESRPKVVGEVYLQPGRAGDRRMVEMEELEKEESEDGYWEYSDECEEGFAEDIEEAEGGQVEAEAEEKASLG